MRSDIAQSLRFDADHAGDVCRHNNQDYSDATAHRYNYPNSKYNTPVTAGTGPDACQASPRYASVPRHYWKTGVQWCDTAVTTPGDKWLGYGKAGTCQDAQDAAHIYPRFYQFGQPSSTDNYTVPAFQRMDFDIGKRLTATYTHNWTDDNGAESVTRTFNDTVPEIDPVTGVLGSEMTNYANWFAYYRTRILATKTITSLAFRNIDTQYRVGLHSLSTVTSNPLSLARHFVNIDDFAAAQKAAWYTELFSMQIPLGVETPSLNALDRIGQYFLNGTQPQLAGSTDPITLSCQKNWHFFFTDGFTNQDALPLNLVGDTDDMVPNYPDAVAKPIAGLSPTHPWPAPFREDGLHKKADALSDYAMTYWVTDLRPAAGPLRNDTNNVPSSVADPAEWQHLNFAALALGTSGVLPAGDQANTEAALTAGTLQWPAPLPSPNKPNNSGVDDLWHAAINGRGQFINAQSPDELALGMGQLLQNALNSAGTRTSVGFQSNTLGGSNTIYQVLFEPGWAGSLAKVTVDINGAVTATLWEASAQLATQLLVDPVNTPTPWFTERRVATMNGVSGTPVPFLWQTISPAQLDSLAPGNTPRAKAILEFLRGNRKNEGTKLGQLRKRQALLGDIVDSSPVYVGPPGAPYLDSNDPGYSGFVNSAAHTRPAHVYVGGNDGMLHAFNDTTGNETWAYVPSALFRGGPDRATGLGALSYQDGALPAFRHHYYVDSTPAVVDVDFNAPAGNKWRTLLVGGLGKGGNRYYALNITDPESITTEANAVAHVLWEFPPVGDTTTDIGYTYGKPIIAKTTGYGWVVIFGSGYNNPSGEGHLFVVQASTGARIATLSTGAGDAAHPAGLAHVAGYTRDFKNQLVDQVYAGDLLGNLWRFDLTAPTAATWTVGLLGRMVDPGGVLPQPVTTPPEIKIDPVNGIDRWVFVGTGKLYDTTDLADHQIQTMYAFRDGTATQPLAPLPSPALSRSAGSLTPLSHDAAQNFGLTIKPDGGWFDDLPAGDRIVVPPRAANGVIAYVATESVADDCLTGLPADIFARDYSLGQSLLHFDPFNDAGALIESYHSDAGGVGLQIVSFPPAAGSDTLDLRLAITFPDGKVKFFRPHIQGLVFGHRMSWRLLGQ
jgi:type IV pilus assembly protein PilY1